MAVLVLVGFRLKLFRAINSYFGEFFIAYLDVFLVYPVNWQLEYFCIWTEQIHADL